MVLDISFNFPKTKTVGLSHGTSHAILLTFASVIEYICFLGIFLINIFFSSEGYFDEIVVKISWGVSIHVEVETFID